MSTPRNAQTAVLTRPRIQALVLLAATALGLYLCFRLVQPFLPALSWGLALAVVGYPIHAFIRSRLGRPTVSAVLTMLVILLIMIVPLVFVTQQLTREVMTGAADVKQALESGTWRQAVEERPRLAAFVNWADGLVHLDDLAPRLAEHLGKWTPTLMMGSFAAAMQLLITMLVLFYFFRDKRDLTADARSYLPLSEREADAVIARVTDSIHATIYGSLTVAAVQGVMGGLMFWLLGLPVPILWGAVMAVLAAIPVTGTFIVWAPAALYLALSGAWVKALILAAWGGIAIALIDNLLYPVLVGRQLHFHPLPVFFSIVGGLWLFGMAGLVLGPLTLSVTSALLDVLRRRTAAQRAVDSRAPAA